MDMLTLAISGIMVNFILFSIFLSFLIFLQLAHISFMIRKNINVIILKEKEIILSAKCLATEQTCLSVAKAWRVVGGGCLLPASGLLGTAEG